MLNSKLNNSQCAQRIIQNSKLKIAAGDNSKLKTHNSKLNNDPISETHY